MKYSIAIVGNKEAILGFKALGLKAFNANSAEEATKVLYELKSEEIINEKTGESKPAYAIIFITEDLAMEISKDDYKKLSAAALPAIIPVPGPKGTTGYGIRRIGKMVEQAVGSDIFK
ncbi:V-type ATP synthase subunit F [Patescibacteria group bacterium]|nr:V-type ATP synthase subunit F [Patescibacteria group bacterium]MBU1702886.1 V-type ATP synthase subunit F [Patescibacteria group bacterium]MBU1953357.1 V-type ATP synthase subunit F [Patescibacteria group bacterium]